MLITTAHLFALHELAEGRAAGYTVRTLPEDDSQEPVYRELELQELVLLAAPRAYQLTSAGREALGLLEAMHEAALLPPLDRLKKDWRFLGSDILAALQAAQRKKGRVGPRTVQMLGARGLTENVHDPLENRSYIRLNHYGEAWGDFARRYRPRLEIDGNLANSIHHKKEPCMH